MRNKGTTIPLRPTEPLLRDLFGMSAARAWGESVELDLADYRAGRIGWSEVACGLIVHGVPGVGKTTFAKALAATCGVPLVATSYANWQAANDGNLGDLVRGIRGDFALAKELAKEQGASIIFIDELDSLPSRTRCARDRSWWTAVVNTLLAELDGIASREGVIALGAANHIDDLDEALARPGRLDTKIAIELPNARELVHILRFHLRPSLETADLGGVGVACLGMSGADVMKLVRDASRRARWAKRELVLDDLFTIIDERLSAISCAALRRIALKNAAQAAVAVLLEVSDDVCTSLVGGAHSGHSMLARVASLDTLTREDVECHITVALAGRAAEAILVGEVSADDRRSRMATHLAAAALGQFGLGKSLVWKGDMPAEQLLAVDPMLSHDVDRMLNRNYERALGLIHAHRTEVGRLADALIAWRALTHADITGLLRPKH